MEAKSFCFISLGCKLCRALHFWLNFCSFQDWFLVFIILLQLMFHTYSLELAMHVTVWASGTSPCISSNSIWIRLRSSRNSVPSLKVKKPKLRKKSNQLSQKNNWNSNKAKFTELYCGLAVCSTFLLQFYMRLFNLVCGWLKVLTKWRLFEEIK